MSLLEVKFERNPVKSGGGATADKQEGRKQEEQMWERKIH